MISNDLLAALCALGLLPLLASGSRRAVGWSIVGSILIILGVASALPDWTALAGAPSTFLAVSAGFVWLGLGCLGFGVWSATMAREPFALGKLGPVGANLGITLAALTTAFVTYRVWPLLFAGSWRGIVAALGLGGTGVVLGTVISLARVARGVRWLDERWLARRYEMAPCLEEWGRRITWGIVLAALAVVVLSPHLLISVAGALTVVVGAHRLAREGGRAPVVPVQPIIVATALLTFTWLVVTIAGPDTSLSFPGILDAPLSETAEAMLALFLGVGAWLLLGLWPFHGAGPGSALALVGGALLIRWGTGLLPHGMVHAAPIFALVATFGALHAAATGRVSEYAAALGVLAVTTGPPGAWALFALASILAAMRLLDYAPPVPGLDRRQLGGIALIPALAAVLPSALRGETVFTVVAVVAGVALFRPSEHP